MGVTKMRIPKQQPLTQVQASTRRRTHTSPESEGPRDPPAPLASQRIQAKEPAKADSPTNDRMGYLSWLNVSLPAPEAKSFVDV